MLREVNSDDLYRFESRIKALEEDLMLRPPMLNKFPHPGDYLAMFRDLEQLGSKHFFVAQIEFLRALFNSYKHDQNIHSTKAYGMCYQISRMIWGDFLAQGKLVSQIVTDSREMVEYLFPEHKEVYDFIELYDSESSDLSGTVRIQLRLVLIVDKISDLENDLEEYDEREYEQQRGDI